MIEENKEKSLSNNKKVIACLAIILGTVFISLLIWFFPKREPEIEDKVDFSGVNRICELATLRCYYHNVATLHKDSKGAFKYGWGKYGYKKYWMEYDGYIDIVINASDVDISEPDEEGYVRVFVPPVEVKNAYPIKESMSEPISETGAFTEITLKDETTALSRAQKEMEEATKIDQAIIDQAHENAKRLLEEYIVNIGNQSGKEYIIKWLDKPLGESEGKINEENYR